MFSVLAGLGTNAFATPTFSLLDNSGEFVAVTLDDQGHTNAIVQDRDGSFWRYQLSLNEWTQIPGANASAGKGAAALYDGHALYVFEVEATGLYIDKLRTGASQWDGWCHLGQRSDLASAPSAAYLGTGHGFEIAVRTTSNALVLYHYDSNDSSSACGTATYQTPSTSALTGTPALVSWGPGRYDVFGRSSAGLLGHWWSENGSAAQFEDHFATTQGTKSFPVATTISAVSAMAKSSHALYVVFRQAGTNGREAIQELIYDAEWSIESIGSGVGAIVDVSSRFYPQYGEIDITPTICSNATSQCIDEFYPPTAFSAPGGVQSVRGIFDPRSEFHYQFLIASGGLFLADDTVNH